MFPEISINEIIVITGASSGFGLMSARALAHAGHTVYAGMRDTAGRNAPRVQELHAYAQQHGVDLRAIEMDVADQASVDAASKLFQNARAEYVEVLLAQRDLMDARTVLIQTRREQLAAIVNAYQALGGGDLLSNARCAAGGPPS